jgi:hypothetical protein
MRAKNYAHVKAWRANNPEARAEEARRYCAKHPDKVTARSKRWRERHIDVRRPLEAERARAMRARNPVAQKARQERTKQRKRASDIAIAGREPPALCELCGEFHGRIVFDHCHVSGRFRGWLCDRCNKVLGLVYDSAELLTKLAAYLEQSNGTTNSEAA